MAKKNKRYFAIAFTTEDGRDINSKNLQYNLPRGAVLGAWHSKSTQKKRIELGKCGYKSAYGDMKTLWNYMDEVEGLRAFVVEISGRIDADLQDEFIASENMRFIKEIQNPNARTLTDAADEYGIITEDEVRIILESVESSKAPARI